MTSTIDHEDRSTWQGWRSGVWIGPSEGDKGRTLIRLKVVQHKATGDLWLRIEATTAFDPDELEPGETETDLELIKAAFALGPLEPVVIPPGAMPGLAETLIKMTKHQAQNGT